MRPADNFPHIYCGGGPPPEQRDPSECFDGYGDLKAWKAAWDAVRAGKQPPPRPATKPTARAGRPGAQAKAFDARALWAQIRKAAA